MHTPDPFTHPAGDSQWVVRPPPDALHTPVDALATRAIVHAQVVCRLANVNG